MATFTVESLLHPIAPGRFFDEYWEQKHLHLARQDPNHYRDLLSAADIDEIISYGDARYPAIRLAKGGAFFPPEAYTRDIHYGDDWFKGVPDVERIFMEYLSGATLSLPALHRSWRPLGRICSQLESAPSTIRFMPTRTCARADYVRTTDSLGCTMTARGPPGD